MSKFGIYLKLQLKRMGKVFPAVFLVTVLLSVGICLLVWMQLSVDSQDEKRQKIVLGVVGDTRDSYLGFGIYALEHLDSSRFTISFSELTEEEAVIQLESGKISGYIRIPDGFLDSIVSGQNMPVTFVGGGAQSGIGTQLVMELSDTVSEVITESQTGIYSMQDFYLEQGAMERIAEDTDRLNLRYFDVLFSRENMYRIEVGDGREGCSEAGYYLCAAVLIFLMLWGINGSIFLIERDEALTKILASSGMGVCIQMIGKIFAYLCLMMVSFFGISGFLILFSALMGFGIQELEGTIDMIRFAVAVLPVICCVAAMQCFLYSMVSSLTEGLLLNFIGTVGLGYLSGCFYPTYFFPQSIQTLAEFLPTGIAMKYLTQILCGFPSIEQMGLLLSYAGLFLGMAIMVKKRKMAR